MAARPASRSCRTGLHGGFTLIETLVTMAIIMILIGLLMPALGMIRHRARVMTAQTQVHEIHMALQTYAAEDRRHRFPPQTGPSDLRLLWDPSGSNPGNVNMLVEIGCTVDLRAFPRIGSAPYAMLDPWGRPYHYQVDSEVLSTTGPQRPLDLPGWNKAGTRPWAYVWSAGKKAESDGTDWIYAKDDQ